MKKANNSELNSKDGYDNRVEDNWHVQIISTYFMLIPSAVREGDLKKINSLCVCLWQGQRAKVIKDYKV